MFELNVTYTHNIHVHVIIITSPWIQHRHQDIILYVTKN